MRATCPPSASVGRLLVSWLALSRWLLSACAVKVTEVTHLNAATVKDAILDLGSRPDEANSAKPAPTVPLPPVPADQLVDALHDLVDQVLVRTAEMINEDPSGCWADVTEEQVLRLFCALGEETLDKAFDLRVRAAEAGCPPGLAPRGEWAHKYRRMLAEEGRWPPG